MLSNCKRTTKEKDSGNRNTKAIILISFTSLYFKVDVLIVVLIYLGRSGWERVSLLEEGHIHTVFTPWSYPGQTHSDLQVAMQLRWGAGVKKNPHSKAPWWCNEGGTDRWIYHACTRNWTSDQKLNTTNYDLNSKQKCWFTSFVQLWLNILDGDTVTKACAIYTGWGKHFHLALFRSFKSPATNETCPKGNCVNTYSFINASDLRRELHEHTKYYY